MQYGFLRFCEGDSLAEPQVITDATQLDIRPNGQSVEKELFGLVSFSILHTLNWKAAATTAPTEEKAAAVKQAEKKLL